MNIFATFPCPLQSAKYLDNKRMIKMILESAQMLSTTITFYNGKAPYKSTHLNHPCTKWVRENRSNYMWLLRHFIALCEEYTSKYHKLHKCSFYTELFLSNACLIPEGNQTEFANCTINKDHNISFKNIKNVHEAYRLYLHERWKYDKGR